MNQFDPMEKIHKKICPEFCQTISANNIFIDFAQSDKVEEYSEPCQTIKMEFFSKIVNG